MSVMKNIGMNVSSMILGVLVFVSSVLLLVMMKLRFVVKLYVGVVEVILMMMFESRLSVFGLRFLFFCSGFFRFVDVV